MSRRILRIVSKSRDRFFGKSPLDRASQTFLQGEESYNKQIAEMLLKLSQRFNFDCKVFSLSQIESDEGTNTLYNFVLSRNDYAYICQEM